MLSDALSAFSHEAQLLACCATPRADEETCSRIRTLAASTLNWNRFFELSYQHRVTALVQTNLRAAAADIVPEPVMQRFDTFARSNAFVYLAQTQELLRIVRLLEQHSVPVIPFKGPSLGQLVYSKPAVRTFGDLDILIHRESFPAVKALLTEEGYQPCRPPQREQAYLRTQMGYEFVSHNGRTVIEVHWAFLNRVHAFPLNPDDVWSRATTLTLAGTQIRSFAPEDLLIYLCAHGSKSFWHRLMWICDIAALIKAFPDLDWEAVTQRTRALHSERMIYLGLYLAHRLFQVDVPPEVITFSQHDETLRLLANQVLAILFQENGRALQGYDRARFHLMMRERVQDRIPYYLHIAHIFFLPNDKDRLVELPPNLSFLYYLLRPIRMISGRLEDARSEAQ